VRDLVIVGAGGFARETAAAVAAVNTIAPTWRLHGFLDDDPALHGVIRSGLPVLGGTALLAAAGPLAEAAVIVCVGNPGNFAARERIVGRLALPERRYATVLHPTVEVGVGSRVKPGSVLLAGTVLTADVTVGAHVAVMPQVVLTHDDVIGDFATLAAGVRAGGEVRVETGAYVGSGALLRERVRIGAGALVGIGATVLHDVPPGEVWAGNPARRLRAVTPVPVRHPPAGVPVGAAVKE